MGEQTEFADGLLLSLALDKRVWVGVEERADNYLRFYSADLNERKKSSLSNLKFKREDRWANYLKGVVFSLQHMGCKLKGLNVTISGEIPHQLGLASSSAMELAFALALRKLFDLDLNDMQLVEAVRLAEYQFMQIDSGISSPLVSMMGKKDQLLLLDSRNLDYSYIPFNLPEYSIIITDTQVPHRVSAAEMVDFRKEFKECQARLKANHIKPVLRELSITEIGSTVEFLTESQRRYCMHIVEENHRVEELLELLPEKNMKRISKLFFRSHESMRDQLEISCPELDWIVKRVQESHTTDGARMIAPGYGGCTIALIHDSNKESYKEILDEYDRIFGFKAKYFKCSPSDGARLE